MGTAVIVALVTSIVAALGVAANALTSLLSTREETKRARESREAEDRRLREDRDAASKRRLEEGAASAAVAATAARDARSQQRWAAVQQALDAEAKVRVSSSTLSVFEYRRALQTLSLLTHADEANLRLALLQRGDAADQASDVLERILRPDWWHPWVSEWARNVDQPMPTATGDAGQAF